MGEKKSTKLDLFYYWTNPIHYRSKKHDLELNPNLYFPKKTSLDFNRSKSIFYKRK